MVFFAIEQVFERAFCVFWTIFLHKIDLWKVGLKNIEAVTTYGPHLASISLKSFRIRLIFFLIRTNSIFLHQHCFKTLSVELSLFVNFRYRFPKQGSLQIIEDKTSIYETISCRLLSFAKVTVKFKIKVSHSSALRILLDQTSNLGAIRSF